MMAASLSLAVQHPTLGNSPKFGRGSTEVRRVRMRGSGRKDPVDDTSLTPSSEDPLRILAPGQKKLSTIESQRVLAVMEEAIKRMKNAMLIPIFATSLERYSVSLGAELVEMLMEYGQLTGEYNRLYSELEQQGIAPNLDGSYETTDVYAPSAESRHEVQGGGSVSSLTGSGHPTRLEPLEQQQGVQTTEEKFQQVRFKLKHCVKCILRALHRNVSTSSVVSATSSAPRNVAALQEEMSNLREVIHGKLLTTHMEEARKKEHLKEVTQRQQLAEQQILKLEAEFSEEQKKKEDLLSKKNAEIKRLKLSIKSVVNLAEDRNRRMKVDAHNQQMQDKQTHDVKAHKLKEEIAVLKKKLQEQKGDHKEKEQSLRKRAFKRETELENWIQKYDHEMGEKQDELEMLRGEYTIETSQLKELDEKLGVLSLEYGVVVQEQEEAKRRAEEASTKMGQMFRAARVIQRGWKRYIEKKKSKKKGKKKGKKGKKGEKGKGGKKKKKKS